MASTSSAHGDGKSLDGNRNRTCGLVMPISAIDGCSAEHWAEVKGIVTDAVESISEPKFDVRLVSDADEVGVIQKRIVGNLYASDVVVCDVSGKNPNVMFELGMRLAFDKPTVIIKDDKTDYSFDTGVIEHLTYPRDLRFNRITSFKASLAEKAMATYLAAQTDANHSTFLKNFGTFQVAKLVEQTIPADRLMLQLMQEMQEEMQSLKRLIGGGVRSLPPPPSAPLIPSADKTVRAALQLYELSHPGCNFEELASSEAFLAELESEVWGEVQHVIPSRAHLRALIVALMHQLGKDNKKRRAVNVSVRAS